MAELKRHFAGSMMNKDLDVRLLSPQHYRDALNIHIATTSGDGAGTVQILKGNTKKNSVSGGSSVYENQAGYTCVGSVADSSKDKIYYLVAGTAKNGVTKDFIFEYNAFSENLKYVFVDIYNVATTAESATTTSTLYVPDNGGELYTGLREGMSLTSAVGDGYTLADDITIKAMSYDSGNSRWQLTLTKAVTLSASDAITFSSKRILNFNKDRVITGINILDDTIFWVDGYSEPKRINITRSIAGTGGTADLTSSLFTGDTPHFHTRVVRGTVAEGSETLLLEVAEDNSGNYPIYASEANATVIRKSPTQAVGLNLYKTNAPRLDSSGEATPSSAVSNAVVINRNQDSVGDILTGITLQSHADFREGDTVIFKPEDTPAESDLATNPLRATVTASSVTSADMLATSGFEFRILNIPYGLPSAATNWDISVEEGASIFEDKFPRFSYRYKYQDGEYSTFAPWSKPAFLPSEYGYDSDQGHNLGMTNAVKTIEITGYCPDNIPADVAEIDIIYKETNNPTVFLVKTIKRGDSHPTWPDYSVSTSARGKTTISELSINAIIPSNQLLRPWDNAPKKAVSQEITANRVVYGNYTQGYNVGTTPNVITNVSSTDVVGDAEPSVKTIRDYTVGVVFSDDYGRETPVLVGDNSSTSVPVGSSDKKNRLSVSMSTDSVVPSWAKYFSYYIKESSTEYHNMVMDSWYTGDDDTVWLAFNSADRNKVTEGSYLALKTSHKTDLTVRDKTKHKVLDISNEAPDSVKRTYDSQGIIHHTSSSSNIGLGGAGFPTQNGWDVFMDKDAVENAFGTNTGDGQNTAALFLPDPEKGLFIVFTQGDLSTQKYKVKHWFYDWTDQVYKAVIYGIFQSDINFASPSESLNMELFMEGTELKPEYEGKFFVKVQRNTAIDTYITGMLDAPEDSDTVTNTASSTSSGYTAVDSWDIGYIHNKGYGDLDYIPSTAIEDGTTQANMDHPTRSSTLAGAAYTWGNHANYPDNAADAVTLEANPIKLNGAFSGATKFWQWVSMEPKFFIDGATAYTYTGQQDDRTGNVNDPDAADPYFSHNHYAQQHPELVMGSDYAASFTSLEGRVGRAISDVSFTTWGPGSKLDLSWSGIGEQGIYGLNPGNELDGPYAHQLSQVAGESDTLAAANQFITTLCTIGTKFRFADDPESIVYTVRAIQADGTGWDALAAPEESGGSKGFWGIRNCEWDATESSEFYWKNLRQRWGIYVTPRIGSGTSAGYSPITGTTVSSADGVEPLNHDFSNYTSIIILEDANASEPVPTSPAFEQTGEPTGDQAVWEVLPSIEEGLDIYYEATSKIPLSINEHTGEELVPVGSTFGTVRSISGPDRNVTHTVTAVSSNKITFSPATVADTENFSSINLTRPDGTAINLALEEEQTLPAVSFFLTNGGPDGTDGTTRIHRREVQLGWNNCWSFGNGVESDRINDDFNAVQMDNGVKASATLAGQIKEETRKSGLIWSGLYNSTSGINDTNQFIAAEKITKDVNPAYGSIQKLLVRGNALVIFSEDKVLRAVTNKDALYNADGSPQLISSNAVIGDVNPYAGEYGISTHPESVAVGKYTVFFSDIIRGQILALSSEGIRPISDTGMRAYFGAFKDKAISKAIGTYDQQLNEYNITLHESYPTTLKYTLAYGEDTRGWVSRRTYTPEMGISLNNSYYTFDNGEIYKHHDNATYNEFYGAAADEPSITVVFNDEPSAIKSFKTLNYEGTSAKVTSFNDLQDVDYLTGVWDANYGLESTDNVNDSEYFNLSSKTGWYAESVVTDEDRGADIEFVEKEGKWFGHLKGVNTNLTNIDASDFTVQGLGTASIVHDDQGLGNPIVITISDTGDAD